jgi:hypothetical protein
MKHRTCLAIALAALIAGCVAEPSPHMNSGLVGVWGENHADCQANPHTISFSPKGEMMHVHYPQGGTADEESLQERFSYQVLGRRSSGLRLALVGESRKDNAGRTVTWELRQPDKDSYCWWRSDWPANECTIPRIRCGR